MGHTPQEIKKKEAFSGYSGGGAGGGGYKHPRKTPGYGLDDGVGCGKICGLQNIKLILSHRN